MISPETAQDILGNFANADFHTLRASEVDALLAYADEYKYRKPRNASGSRARYFFHYLQRRAARED